MIAASCNSGQNANSDKVNTIPDVHITGAMKDVMHKGMLNGVISSDTLEQKGLYGLGPVSYLRGEILIMDGNAYASYVAEDSQMIVMKSEKVSAPFFVYSNVTDWDTLDLPDEFHNIKDVEAFLDEGPFNEGPFAFVISGNIEKATIHCQNLAPGTEVHSPKEAHQGQVTYKLGPADVDVVGFFSKDHQGVFTHHDAFTHMHLITSDRMRMGHLDDVEWGKMKLMVPRGIARTE